ncbi:MAG: hypothetical protein A2493_01585 [Candidatus Magasanikbacteria bacterium RIFOXYC12_FULL_33_11]|uniref:Uncharacterized protein n=1 Tax=Candidatus Magasanikbacteria bacterium RIFOXYC12_FULL_33_11 TaxID=1798701 RepID=A0A1F6NRB0_9BACT|nr:MAG: hypothetical protein A2493_01585 [Candidatus Magasanikbacteria bacterium RIFOXYC12_FULL_33_11]
MGEKPSLELSRSHVCLRKEEIKKGVRVRIVPDTQKIFDIPQIENNITGLQNTKKLQDEMSEVYEITASTTDEHTGEITLTLQKVEYNKFIDNKLGEKLNQDKIFIKFEPQKLIKYHEIGTL